MGKSKKTDNSKVEARPVGQGKDPLAEGNTLENPTNTEAETHYNVKERGEDVQAKEAENIINGQDANARAEQHNAQAVNAPSDVPNSDAEEQDEVAAGREEPGEEPAPVDESPAEEGAETPAEEASEPAAPAEPAPSAPEVPAADEGVPTPPADQPGTSGSEADL